MVNLYIPFRNKEHDVLAEMVLTQIYVEHEQLILEWRKEFESVLDIGKTINIWPTSWTQSISGVLQWSRIDCELKHIFGNITEAGTHCEKKRKFNGQCSISRTDETS